jgi:NAD(P)-dependent dehydrogenase (short-subunit alcohol dehydrogenase family)
MEGLLVGKVGLVTGSGRGLGQACARALAREGAKVAVVDRNREDGEATVAMIEQAGGSAIFIEADVGLSEDIQRMVETTVGAFGGLDCAINNAVCNIGRAPLAEITEEDWDRAGQVNITGFFLCMKYEIRAMLARGGGAIVNIGSGNEHSSQPGLAWYLGAKQAVYGMTKCAALDYGDKGIRINAVGPGSMWTPSLRETATQIPQHVETLSAMAALKRLAEPEEVAEAAVWLCSPKSSYVTGITLVADGGAVLG